MAGYEYNPIPKDMEKPFLAWLKATYGTKTIGVAYTITNPRFQEWVNAGKPGYTAPKQAKPKVSIPSPSVSGGGTITQGWGNQPTIPQHFVWSPPTQGVTPGVTPEVTTGLGELPADVTVRGSVYYSPSKDTYYDPTTGYPMDKQTAMLLYNQWLNQVSPGTLGTTSGAQWRPGELEFEKEQFQWKKEQAGLAGIQSQSDMELQFEKDRNQLLQGIPSDDWIRRYAIQNQPNPYKVQEETPLEKTSQLLDAQTAQVQQTQKELATVNLAIESGVLPPSSGVQGLPILSDRLGTLQERLDSEVKARDYTYKVWKSMKDEGVNWTPQVPQPYPSTPGWMSQYVPGLEAGQMITKQRVPTPSGQQLTAMPTSQLNQLGYYGEWAGSPLSSARAISESAALMQPNTPFTKTRWSPVGSKV